MKYEVRVEGHMETRKAFSALLEVEADSEEDAKGASESEKKPKRWAQACEMDID